MHIKPHQIVKFVSLILFATIVTAGPENKMDIPDAEREQGNFREGFDKDVNVSGDFIMGLTLGEGTGLKSLDELYVDKSGVIKRDVFCLRSSSSDGVFWAENAFTAEGSQSIWRISPVTQKFKSHLKKYGTDHIVSIVGFVSSGKSTACESSEYIYAPVVQPFESDKRTLTVFLNSSGRKTEIKLSSLPDTDIKPVIIRGECDTSKLDGAIAYDNTCTINLEAVMPGGTVELQGSFKNPPFDTEQWVVKIALPDR